MNSLQCDWERKVGRPLCFVFVHLFTVAQVTWKGNGRWDGQSDIRLNMPAYSVGEWQFSVAA